MANQTELNLALINEILNRPPYKAYAGHKYRIKEILDLVYPEKEQKILITTLSNACGYGVKGFNNLLKTPKESTKDIPTNVSITISEHFFVAVNDLKNKY